VEPDHARRVTSPFPITTVAGLTIAGLIAGTVVVENAFALNGLGWYLVEAVGQKDIPVVQAICLILVAAFIVVNPTPACARR
jgi:peptide/nickel transport system permease protein